MDVAADARRMRDLMARERPGQGAWDLKLAPGGQVDAEFVAQVHQLKAAAGGGPLTDRHNTTFARLDAAEIGVGLGQP